MFSFTNLEKEIFTNIRLKQESGHLIRVRDYQGIDIYMHPRQIIIKLIVDRYDANVLRWFYEQDYWISEELYGIAIKQGRLDVVNELKRYRSSYE